MSVTTVILRRWARTVETALAATGLPIGIASGETFADGRAVFNVPAPETTWARNLARVLGVARVKVTLQVEVCPFVVVVHEAPPKKTRRRPASEPLEADWTPCYVGPEVYQQQAGCWQVTGVHGRPYMMGG